MMQLWITRRLVFCSDFLEGRDRECVRNMAWCRNTDFLGFERISRDHLDLPLSSRERFLPGLLQLVMYSCWSEKLSDVQIATRQDLHNFAHGHLGISASSGRSLRTGARYGGSKLSIMRPKLRSLRNGAKYSGYIHITFTGAPSGRSLPTGARYGGYIFHILVPFATGSAHWC